MKKILTFLFLLLVSSYAFYQYSIHEVVTTTSIIIFIVINLVFGVLIFKSGKTVSRSFNFSLAFIGSTLLFLAFLYKIIVYALGCSWGGYCGGHFFDIFSFTELVYGFIVLILIIVFSILFKPKK